MRRLSIRQTLPLLIGALLVLVIGIYSWAAYRAVRRVALAAGSQRLASVAEQLAGLLETSGRQLVTATQSATRDQFIRAYLRSPGEATRPRALAALRRAVPTTAQVVGMELWDAQGTRMLALPIGGPGVSATLEPDELRRALGPDSGAVGRFRQAGDSLIYPGIAPVGDRGAVLGYVVQWRRIASTPRAREQTVQLIGSGAALYLGNDRGDLWTDLVRAVPRPVSEVRLGSRTFEYERPGSGGFVAGARAVPGTPWIVLVEFPLGVLLDPAHAFLGRMTLIALLIVFAALVATRVISGGITGPLDQVTGAAEAIAAGDYTRRVGDSRHAELGRLALAFNTMAGRVREAQHRLEERVEERTRELREQQQFLDSMIELIPHMIFVKEAKELRFVRFNRAGEELLGLSREELIGKNDYDFFPRSEADFFVAKDREVLERGRVLDIPEEPIHTRDKGVRTLHTKKVPVFDAAGRPLYLLGISEDITEWKRTQEALQASEARHRLLFELSPIPMWVYDLETLRFLAVNEAAVRHYGYSQSEFLGMTIKDIRPPEDVPALLARIPKLGPGVDSAGEWRHRKRGGEVIDVEIRAHGIVFEGRKAELVLVNDVTERKRAEEEIRKLNAELAHRVSELTDLNQELDSFSYSVSHDLRAPLRQIDGFSNLLQEALGRELPVDAQRHLQRIRDGARKMGVLIDDLLQLARLSRQPLSKSRTDLGAVLRSVVYDLRDVTQDRRIDWRIATLPVVECDARLTRQVFENLVSNALKFTRSRTPAVIEIGHRMVNGQAAIFVRDNGVGFEMQYADKLFGVFQRLHRAEDFEGTGVGLATVQRIVHSHGGRVWVEAELDQGATFYFTLGDVSRES